jgi:adenosylcobyric acid synthase
MNAIMVQGTSSWAGKSLLATVLCRHFARQGLRVAPFKAQNMSNNARVAARADGQWGEIGTAQWLQARAANATPHVRMNPVLVKPEGDTRSQVIVDGLVDAELSGLPWRHRGPRLRPVVERALSGLLADSDLIVIEGAGSPAEINLADIDLANTAAAQIADAPVLLVADVDRGGAFAHLYGTWALLEPRARERIAGFILNKFRGDASLLAPAPERLTGLTGVPFLGTVPMLSHDLPDEDGAAAPVTHLAQDRPVVAVVRYPYASNLDEFKPLEQVCQLRWAQSAGALADADLVVLPGSKHVAADLGWLRSNGVGDEVTRRAHAGHRVLGICGGLQMLGQELRDDDGGDGDTTGLGLLRLHTSYRADKVIAEVSTQFPAGMEGPWGALAGQPLRGYEIRHGRTEPTAECISAQPGTEPIDELAVALPENRGWHAGAVLGLTVHGLWENPHLVRGLLGHTPNRSLDEAIDDLTDAVMAHLNITHIEDLAGTRT